MTFGPVRSEWLPEINYKRHGPSPTNMQPLMHYKSLPRDERRRMKRSDEHFAISRRPQNPEKRILRKGTSRKGISEKRSSTRLRKLEKRVSGRSRAPRNQRRRKRRRRRVAKSARDLGFSDSDESLDLLTLIGKARRNRGRPMNAPSNFDFTTSNPNAIYTDVGNNYSMSGAYHAPTTQTDVRSVPSLKTSTSQDTLATPETEEVEITEGLLSRRRLLRNANIPSKLLMYADGTFAIPDKNPEGVTRRILKTPGSKGSGRKVSWDDEQRDATDSSNRVESSASLSIQEATPSLPHTVSEVGPSPPDSATDLCAEGPSTVEYPLERTRKPSPTNQEPVSTVGAPSKTRGSPTNEEPPPKPVRRPSPAQEEPVTVEAPPIPTRSRPHQEPPPKPVRRPSPAYQVSSFQKRLSGLLKVRYGDVSSPAIYQSSV